MGDKVYGISRKQYWAIKNAPTKTDKALVDFYELQWHLLHRVPTIKEVSLQLKITETEVNQILTKKPIQKALESRGITNWRQHTQVDLTSEQVAAALTVMNFVDQRSIEQKLDQLGILPATYYAWQNDPQFKNLLTRLADENLGNIRPTAIAEFTKLVNKGDWQAIKYYLDVSGEFKQEGTPQAEVLLRMIIEVIQKHVKDPNTIAAIAADLSLISASKKVEASINGSYVETGDNSLTVQEALGQLGY